MDVSGQLVRFHLSAESRRALRGLVPAKGSFTGYVLDTNDLGLLVSPALEGSAGSAGQSAVLLLKWDYVVTVTFDYRQQEPSRRPPIGFRTA
jgi:hypothetical protein